MKPRRNRLEYRQENWPSFVLMHVIFFLIQLFFFWIFFGEAWFSAYIPVIYYRIQQIGYPTVLICSLIWLNRTLYPGEAKYMLVSIGMFLLEWFGIDRLIVH